MVLNSDILIVSYNSHQTRCCSLIRTISTSKRLRYMVECRNEDRKKYTKGSRYACIKWHILSTNLHFCTQPFLVTTGLNCLEKTNLKCGHSIGFSEENKDFKIVNTHAILDPDLSISWWIKELLLISKLRLNVKLAEEGLHCLYCSNWKGWLNTRYW